MFTFQEILHETFITIVATALLTVGLAIFGKMKENWGWPTIIVYGVVVAACVLFIFGRLWPPAWRERVTDENVELKIREWLADFNLGSTKVETPDGTYFKYEIPPTRGNATITIVRTKDRPGYLTFATRLSLSKEDKSLYDKLTESQRDMLVLQLRSKLAEAKVRYILESDPFTVGAVSRVPITGLTESTFLQQIDDVAFGETLANDTIEIALIGQQKTTQPSPTPSTEASPH